MSFFAKNTRTIATISDVYFYFEMRKTIIITVQCTHCIYFRNGSSVKTYIRTNQNNN